VANSYLAGRHHQPGSPDILRRRIQHMHDNRQSVGPKSGNLNLYKSPEGQQKIVDWYDAALKRIDADTESVWVDTRFGRTHMLAAGSPDDEPLFFLPGVAGAAPLFRRQLEGLADRFRVYAVDLPGQPGRSDPNPPSFLDKSYVEWFADLLDGLGLESAHVGGQSAGGGIALTIGVEAPERVRSVFMFGPTGLARARLPVKIWVTKGLSKRSADALEDDLTAKSIRPKRTGESFGTYDRELARLMALATRNFRLDRALLIANEQSGKLSIPTGLRILHKFFFAEKKSWLRRLKVPALLIFGEHELLLNPEKVAAKTKKLIPHIQTEIVPNAGHGAVFDQPEIVNELVADFINRVAAQR
jgi:pimeloyl-ACP methyl ester carboxylesterase